jgi:hypothetical protein
MPLDRPDLNIWDGISDAGNNTVERPNRTAEEGAYANADTELGGGGGAALSELSVTVGDLIFGSVSPATQESITITGDGSGSFSAGKLVFTGDTDTFRIFAFNGDEEDTPFECDSGDYFFAMSGAASVTFLFDVVYTDGAAKSMGVSVVNLEDGVEDDSLTATATVNDDLIVAVQANMTDIGIWFLPAGATGDIAASGQTVLQDFSGNGESAFEAVLSLLGNWHFDTTDKALALGLLDRGSIDCEVGHLDGEYAAVLAALSTTAYCGGFIFKIPTTLVNPEEETIFALSGTVATPFNVGNGTVGNAFMVSYPGFGLSGPGAGGSGAAAYFGGGGWYHLQWRRTGASDIHFYLSLVGGAFKGVDDTAATGVTYSTGAQIGHGGTVGGGVNLKVAAVYLGSDTALSEAALEAIHNDSGLGP